MNEPFILTVNYQDTEYEFKARSERWGYTHRIAVLIGEATFTFEPDEEGSYRAFNEPAGSSDQVDTDLLKAIAERLVKLNNI